MLQPALGDAGGEAVLACVAVKYGTFDAETTLEATDSDPYVKFNIGVVMLASLLCAAMGWGP